MGSPLTCVCIARITIPGAACSSWSVAGDAFWLILAIRISSVTVQPSPATGSESNIRHLLQGMDALPYGVRCTIGV